MAISFDECFQTYPELHSPTDLDEFWSEAIRDLKTFRLKTIQSSPQRFDYQGNHL